MSVDVALLRSNVVWSNFSEGHTASNFSPEDGGTGYKFTQHYNIEGQYRQNKCLFTESRKEAEGIYVLNLQISRFSSVSQPVSIIQIMQQSKLHGGDKKRIKTSVGKQRTERTTYSYSTEVSLSHLAINRHM
jgi:hypothetical protein